VSVIRTAIVIIEILEVINLGADITFNKVDVEMIVEKNFVAL